MLEILQTQLGYKRWGNFIEVIKKATLSCENAEIPRENHFCEVTKMIRKQLSKNIYESKKMANNNKLPKRNK